MKLWCGEKREEVTSNKKVFIIDLSLGKCSYRKWEVSVFLCSHAMKLELG